MREIAHISAVTCVIFAPVFMITDFAVGAGAGVLGVLTLIHLGQLDKPKPVFYRGSRSHRRDDDEMF